MTKMTLLFFYSNELLGSDDLYERYLMAIIIFVIYSM
jgi:hypothetical protein